MIQLGVKELLEAGVHFGHRTQRWNPKVRPYLFEEQNGTHLIDLDQTVVQLKKAQEFLRKVSAEGRRVLFVGCKKQAQAVIQELAPQSRSYHITNRWLGGTLTNLSTIRKSIRRLKEIEMIESRGTVESMPKKEVASMRREFAKLHRNLDGVRDMERFPGALVIVDIVRENIAVQEARRLSIPIVALVDTNADPNLVDYPIVANDDAMRSIRLLMEALHSAVLDGQSSAPAEKTKGSGSVSGAKGEAPSAPAGGAAKPAASSTRPAAVA